jgi:hypothetical protein
VNQFFHMTSPHLLKLVFFNCIIILTFGLSSCESDAERKSRLSLEAELFKIELAQEEEIRIQKEIKLEEAQKLAAKKKAEAEQAKADKLAAEKRAKEEKERYEKYINNQLNNGSQPFAACFGRNVSCSDYICSSINVITPSSSDVLVTLKKNSKVYRHVYIQKGKRGKVDVPNGSYQVFFSYGSGWDPDKKSPIKNCSKRGWFVKDNGVSKDETKYYESTEVTITLQLTEYGNFEALPSNIDEAF